MTVFLDKYKIYTLQRDIVENPDELRKFKRMMLTTCDQSGDGSLQRDEIALWLGIENY